MYKVLIILLLVLVNTALLTWYFVEHAADDDESVFSGTPVFDTETLRNAFFGIFRTYAVEEYNIRERTVQPGIRSEMRVAVPAEVSMASLNFEIHRAARAMGYRVSAREDSRTGHLSIHIRDKNAIVLTVIVVRQ